MDKIVYKLVYNRKKVLNPRGTALVQVEAYQARKKKYFTTQVYLRPGQWDARRERVKHHPNADRLNRLLHEQVECLESLELELRQSGRQVSLETLKTAAKQQDSRRSFIAFSATKWKAPP